MERRDRTSIKIQILKTLYLKGQMGIYSAQLGSLVHEVCTNYYTFSKALMELEREGLVYCEHITTDCGRVKIVRITEDGRRLVAPSLPLINKLHISS